MAQLFKVNGLNQKVEGRWRKGQGGKRLKNYTDHRSSLAARGWRGAWQWRRPAKEATVMGCAKQSSCQTHRLRGLLGMGGKCSQGSDRPWMGLGSREETGALGSTVSMDGGKESPDERAGVAKGSGRRTQSCWYPGDRRGGS